MPSGKGWGNHWDGGQVGSDIPNTSANGNFTPEQLGTILGKVLRGQYNFQTQGSALDDDSEMLGSNAKGTEAIERLVAGMEREPWRFIQNFENEVMRQQGIMYAHQPWSLDTHAADSV